MLVTLMSRTSVDRNKRRGWPVYVSGSPGTALKLLIASSFSQRSSVDKSTMPRAFVDSSSRKAKVQVGSYIIFNYVNINNIIVRRVRFSEIFHAREW